MNHHGVVGMRALLSARVRYEPEGTEQGEAGAGVGVLNGRQESKGGVGQREPAQGAAAD